jgi:hypothetical protein
MKLSGSPVIGETAVYFQPVLCRFSYSNTVNNSTYPAFIIMPSIVLHYVIIASITVMFIVVNRFYGHKTSIDWKENNEQL